MNFFIHLQERLKGRSISLNRNLNKCEKLYNLCVLGSKKLNAKMLMLQRLHPMPSIKQVILSKFESREKFILHLKDKSLQTIIIAFIIGVALFELGTIILINRSNLNEDEAYALCEKKLNEQQYGTAVKYLKGFVRRFPESEKIVDAMYALAISYQKKRDFSSESKVWQQIIQHNNPAPPEKVQEAYYNLGICHENLDNIKFALKSYDVASKGADESIAKKALFSVGRLFREQNLDSKAVLAYQLIMKKFPHEESAQEAADEWGNLNLKHLLEDYKTTYRVKPGDNLISIAKRFNTTIPVIMKLNGLKNDNLIKIGIKLKISTARFSLDIGVEDKLAYLLCDGYIVKQYPIATDSSDKPIPTGEFSIISKEENPTWYSPDDTIPTGDLRNGSGTRWIGIEDKEKKKHELAIYGTNNLKNIGQAVGGGYIWLRNEDIEELFSLMSVNDTVQIVERLETRVWYSWVQEINNAYGKETDNHKHRLTSQK